MTGIYGWWAWGRGRSDGGAPVHALSAPRVLIAWVAATAAASLALGRFLEGVHLHWPSLFPEPASYPYLDAATTLASFTAQILLAWRRTETWYYWIAVDVVGVGLYAAKGVWFVAGLYAVLLVLAIRGLLSWRAAACVEDALSRAPAGTAGRAGTRVPSP